MQQSVNSRDIFKNAKKLTGKFERIETDYLNFLSNEKVAAHPADKIDVLLKTIVYLLARTGHYIGSNDPEQQPNGVDLLSMQVKHVDFLKESEIHFKWIDKHEMGYDKTLSVNGPIYTLFKGIIEGKSEDDKIFDELSHQNVLDYVDTTYGNGIKPKDFRTYIASKTFEKKLDELTEQWLSEPRVKRYSGLLKQYRNSLMFVQELLNLQHVDAVDSHIDPRIIAQW